MRRFVVGVAAGVVLIGAATAAAAGFGGRDPAPAAGTGLPPATAKVTRQTLTQTEQVDGTLGYGDATTVVARAAGTVTWLPAAGTVVSRGRPLYRVDNHPVPLLYGTLPLYRPLAPGVSGPDVKEFEQNLAALGYHGFTVDDDYTPSTASAVKRWQDALGVPQTGTVAPAAAVVAPGAVRVAARHATLGAAAGGPVLDYTGTTRLVTVDLDVAQQDLVKNGVAATVTLPSGATVRGTVTSVGTAATAAPAAGGADAGTGGGTPDATIPVTIGLADQSALGSLDGAPVRVTLVSARAAGVLAVPVAALLALAEGGYGVQVVDGSTSRYVAVKTGMFAGGLVEISGTGIAAGTVVGVPR